MKPYICSFEGCGREAEFVRFDSEELVIPNGAKLPRKPGSERLRRYFWIKCPVHGMRWLITQGHHVSPKHPRAK
jgi:hypothetical protein